MRPLENGKWDPLEALPAQEGQAYRWFAVPVRLGLWEATAQVWLPQGMQQAVAGTPWEPKDLVKCAAALGKPGQAEELWSQLLQALAPALQDGELAPELTDAVVEEALGGDIRAVTALLARQPAIGHGIFGQCATAGRLCGAILLDCLAAGRWEQAAALLEEYRQGTQNPPRLPPEELLRALMEQCRRRGLLAAEAAQVLRQAIARLPEPVRRPLYGFHRKVFGAAPLEKPPLPPAVPAAAEPPGPRGDANDHRPADADLLRRQAPAAGCPVFGAGAAGKAGPHRGGGGRAAPVGQGGERDRQPAAGAPAAPPAHHGGADDPGRPAGGGLHRWGADAGLRRVVLRRPLVGAALTTGWDAV